MPMLSKLITVVAPPPLRALLRSTRLLLWCAASRRQQPSAIHRFAPVHHPTVIAPAHGPSLRLK